MPTFNIKYEVIDKIGEGSFAEVLTCVDKGSGRKYAAKRLKRPFPNLEEAFTSAELVATQILTDHPNVLNMLEYYYSVKTGNLIFIFELMDMSLYEYLRKRKRPMPETRVKNYLYQILKGVEHLHVHGIFHRDIKPENILMKTLEDYKYELIKIADFGSIRGIYSEQPYTDYISTRWYRSPECLLTTGFYGPKMDIWAAGCVFYEMLTMKPLFPGVNEIDQLAKIHHVLGTPNIRFVHKLKNRSQNFDHFPKKKGIGLSLMLPLSSVDTIRVLRLMLEYDPENRINARRLLDQNYFVPFRYNDMKLKIDAPYVESSSSFSPKMFGDFKSNSFRHSSFIGNIRRNSLASKSFNPAREKLKSQTMLNFSHYNRNAKETVSSAGTQTDLLSKSFKERQICNTHNLDRIAQAIGLYDDIGKNSKPNRHHRT